MKEIRMTRKMIANEIDFEDRCGVNTFLQTISSPDMKNARPYQQINENNQICGYVFRDKATNKEVGL